MFLEILFFLSAGIALGVLTGLIPGIHPNTLFVMLMPFLITLSGTGAYALISFVVSLAVTNSITSFIPSIFLGAPEDGTSLSVLPGHRFLLKGLGHEAVVLTVAGAVTVTTLTAISSPFLMWFLPMLYSYVKSYIHILLAAVLLALLLPDRKRHYGLFFFIVSGISGILLLSSFSSQQAMFPALTGLFGLPVIITSMSTANIFPKQKIRGNKDIRFIKGGFTGWLAGMLVGILPGVGPSQAGVLSNTLLRGREKDFMISLGGINTAAVTLTFISLHTLMKTRSGAALAIYESMGIPAAADVYFIIFTSLFSCFMASLITLKLSRGMVGIFPKISYKAVNTAVLSALIIIIVIISGLNGIVIAALCTVLGVSCGLLGVRRMYLMGFLMLPTIIYFSGLTSFTLNTLFL